MSTLLLHCTSWSAVLDSTGSTKLVWTVMMTPRVVAAVLQRPGNNRSDAPLDNPLAARGSRNTSSPPHPGSLGAWSTTWSTTWTKSLNSRSVPVLRISHLSLQHSKQSSRWCMWGPTPSLCLDCAGFPARLLVCPTSANASPNTQRKHNPQAFLKLSPSFPSCVSTLRRAQLGCPDKHRHTWPSCRP